VIHRLLQFLRGPQPKKAPRPAVELSAADRTEFARLNQVKASRVPTRGLDFARAQFFLQLQQPSAAIEALKEELRFFPDHAEAAAKLRELIDGQPAGSIGDDPELQELYAAIRSYTMLSPARVRSLFTLAKTVCSLDLPGNFVECGVAAGGSSALLAAIIARHSRQPRRLFSCDTFEGMPPATAEDTHRGQAAEESGWGTGTCAAPLDSLRQIAQQLGVEAHLQPLQGLFADTLPAHRAEIGPIAFLHMDGDWYSSTRDILVNLFDQVVPGGRIQIDDFGYWEGCRKAVHEFERERGLTFTLHPIDATGVWLEK
jgi:hypothetical protein